MQAMSHKQLKNNMVLKKFKKNSPVSFKFVLTNITKLDGVAPFVADPPRCNSPTRQNQHDWDSPLYITITFEPVMGF